MSFSLLLLMCAIFHLGSSSEPVSEIKFSKAEIQSCSGCSLNRLPLVKSFIFEDVPKYDGVTFKHIQGALPELVLFGANFEEVERIPLSDLSRTECNSLLTKKGFQLKTEEKEL